MGADALGSMNSVKYKYKNVMICEHHCMRSILNKKGKEEKKAKRNVEGTSK